jgi:hypothetical protein
MQLPPPPHFQNISSQPRQMTALVQRLDIKGLWPKYYKRPVIEYTVEYAQILANIHITTTYSSYWHKMNRVVVVHNQKRWPSKCINMSAIADIPFFPTPSL